MIKFDPNLFLEYPQKVWIFLGIWPIKKPTAFNIIHEYLLVIGVSYVFMVILSGGIYQVKDNFSEMASASYYVITHLTYIIKYTTFVATRDKFQQLLTTLKQPIFIRHLSDQTRYQTEFLRITQTYMKLFYGCCFFVWAFYGLYPVLDSSSNSSLPMRTWQPFSVNSTVNYSLLYLFEMLALGVAISNNASYDVMSSALMNIGCVQIQILKDNLAHATRRSQNSEIETADIGLLSKEEDELVHGVIVKSIEHHKFIIRYLKDIESIFGIGIFFQFISGGIIICILGLEITVLPLNSLKFAMTLFYLMAMVSQNTLYCWNGNQIIVESSDIGQSCYTMDWYRCSPKVKKSLIILMERAKVPLKVTAGNFFQLTLITLTMILRSSYSYFAVLQQVYNK